MTQADTTTEEQVPATAAAESPDAVPEVSAQAAPAPETPVATPDADPTAELPKVPVDAGAESPDLPAVPDQTEAPKVEAVEPGPELVEPVPLKDITFPDTPELRRILRLQVPMIVRLADKIMPFGEIMQLAPGAIIEFNKSVQEPLDLMINNKCIGSGQAVKVGEKFGIKVGMIASLRQMIRAMGGE